jgi:putative lipoprotein
MFALWLVGMAGWAGQAAGQVHGTATYRERLALPPEAVFEATLEDVSPKAPRSPVVHGGDG